MEAPSQATIDAILQKRFALLEKSRIHRIAEKCFRGESPPIRERIVIAKGLGDVDRDINIIKPEPKIDMVTYHPIDPEQVQQYKAWLEQRKGLRSNLEQLGNYTTWVLGKKNPTALESRVLQADINKANELIMDNISMDPPTPDMVASSIGDSELDGRVSSEPSPPPVGAAIRILQDYVTSRRLRLIDLFTQIDSNKSWKLSKHELQKMGLNMKQIEELLGPLEHLKYKDLNNARNLLHTEERLAKKGLRPPLPPILSDEQSEPSEYIGTPDLGNNNGLNTPSNRSRSSSLDPLEWIQYSHKLVPSHDSDFRKKIQSYRDETWKEFNNLVKKCKKEGIQLSVLTLAKGLLAPGDRRWEDCTQHLRHMTGLEALKLQPKDSDKGCNEDTVFSDTAGIKLRKISKFYDSTSQYRDIRQKNPPEKLRLSTGVAMVRPKTDCWMSYEEYVALTANVRTKFRWVFGSQAPWCGHLLDKIRLCMPLEISVNQSVSLFTHSKLHHYTHGGPNIPMYTSMPDNDGGYKQTATRVREYTL